MGATTGLVQVGTYATVTVAATATQTAITANITALKALIPDPDTAPAQGGGNNLDQMAPGTAAQIRVELDALAAALTV